MKKIQSNTKYLANPLIINRKKSDFFSLFGRQIKKQIGFLEG